MNIVFLWSLSYNQSISHITPLAELDCVKAVYIPTMGPKGASINKVKYYTIPVLVRKLHLRMFYFFFLICYLMMKYSIKIFIIQFEGIHNPLLFVFLNLFFRCKFVAHSFIHQFPLQPLLFERGKGCNLVEVIINYVFSKKIFYSLWKSFYSFTLNKVSAVISVCEKSKFFLEHINCIDQKLSSDVAMLRKIKKPIFTIPYFIDLERFRNRYWEKKYDLITVGVLNFRKNIQVFLNLIYELKKVDISVSGVIVGDGPIKEELMTIAKRLNVKESVSFIGYTPHVEEYLNQAKIFVLTSSNEGISVACAEAMACELPVISFAVGGMDELIVDGYNGFLVSPFDTKSLFERSYFLLTHPQKITEMGKNARKTVEEKFHLGKIKQKWETVLNSIS